MTEDQQRATATRLSRRALIGATGMAGLATLTVGTASTTTASIARARLQQADSVLVYPAHGTRTASAATEISFRGVTEAELGPVYVTGTISGGHAGIMAPHADGNGVSYLPDSDFEPGERVTVRADIPLGPAAEGAMFFDIVRPAKLIGTRSGFVIDDPEVEPQTFVSRPDLKPPVMEITTPPAPGTAPGLVILGSKVKDGQYGTMILDNDGELVWYSLPPVPDYEFHDVRVQEYQGEPVLTWSVATTGGGFGQGHFVIANQAYEHVAEVQAGNGYTSGGDIHEFLLTPDGTALFILYQAVDWDLSPAGGSSYGGAVDGVVQEIEIATGRVVFEWHCLDHIGVEESYIAIASSETPERPADYVHMNSVEVDPEGNIIVSNRHTFAIYKISRQTGEIMWRLGGKRSDFALSEEARFAWQHDARIHANGELSLFDNHEVNPAEDEVVWSRGMVFDLDEATMTATLVREYVHPDQILGTSQGNMQVLPNGNVFIGWGSDPNFSEFSPDGELLFNGRFPEGGNSYRAYRAPWVGEPAAPPDIAAEVAGGAMTVYASWNGATEVASWRVLAGPAPDNLAVVATADRTGFETAIEVDTTADYVAAEALNAGGAIIGASVAIETGVPPATPVAGG